MSGNSEPEARTSSRSQLAAIGSLTESAISEVKKVSEKARAQWTKRWAEGEYHARTEPSALVVAWADRVPKGRALDLGCGNGRNALCLAERGFTVDAVDIAPAALKVAQEAARDRGLTIHLTEADLDEHPLPADTYDLITASFFLSRNLVPKVKEALKPNGFVIYEHHYLTDHPGVFGPTDRDWRLRSNELLRLFLENFRIHYFWEGLENERERLVAVQRLVAQKLPASLEPGPPGPGST